MVRGAGQEGPSDDEAGNVSVPARREPTEVEYPYSESSHGNRLSARWFTTGCSGPPQHVRRRYLFLAL